MINWFFMEANYAYGDGVFLPVIKSRLAWWAVLSGYKVKENINKCDLYTTKSIDYLSNLEKPNLNKQLDLIDAYILQLRLKNYVGSKVRTIPVLFKVLNRIKDLIKGEEVSDRKKLVLGLYYYFVDYIDNKYLFAGSILKRYPKGGRAKGLKLLNSCLNSKEHFVQVEANYFLYKIYFAIENNYSLAYKNIFFLHNLYPNNMVFNYEMYKTMKENKDVKAELFKQSIMTKIINSNTLDYTQKAHFAKLLNEYK